MSQKISQFTQIVTLASGDFFPVVQASGVTNKSIQVGALDQRYFIVASGNFAQSTANTALASGNAALTSAALKLPLIGGTLTGDLTINAQGDLRLADADSSNYVAIQAASVISSNVTFTAPSADGTNGQVLTTNGSGTLSFTTAAGGATDKIEEGNTSAEVIDTGSDGRFVVTTEGTERLRVDPSGRLLVGTSTTPTAGNGQYAKLVVQGYAPSTPQGGGYFSLQRGQAATGFGTNEQLGLINFGDNTGASFALIEGYSDASPGANDFPGRLVFSTTADGASAPTERMRIQANGAILLGVTSDAGSNTAGIYANAFGGGAGQLFIVRNAANPCTINRLADDGTVMAFQQAGTEEGNISVSGTTVSYNGAHLSRWSQLPSGQERTEILRGSVLSNIDEMCEWIDPPKEAVLWQEGEELPEGVSVGDIKEPTNPGGPQDNEQLNRMKVSEIEGDKNVSGVFQCWDDDDDTYTNDFYCAMNGDFIIRIADGVTVERGDLLMSAGDGTAKPQDDDIIRSKTVAKVTSTNVTCTYEDGSYCVPCVLMAC